jgi:hypothetical protein
MGGVGSGSWYRWDKKNTAESQHRVDVRYMKRHGFLRPGMMGQLSWTWRGQQTGSVGYLVMEGRLILHYRHRPRGGEWEDVEETVWFDRTYCNYGGMRIWFRCPHCVRRVAVLYGAGKRFLCRHCYSLTYASQQEGCADRLLRKAQGIRRRLGGSESLSDPLPPKPKGMHWRTYWRLCEEVRWAERKSLALLL